VRRRAEEASVREGWIGNVGTLARLSRRLRGDGTATSAVVIYTEVLTTEPTSILLK
jgi:hypothetical protein